MTNATPNKPKHNHPWRTMPGVRVQKWAKEQSEIRKETTVRAARPKTLKTNKDVARQV